MRRTRGRSGQAGASVLEYTILLAVLAGVGVAAATTLGISLDDMVTTLTGRIAGIGST